MGFTRRDVGAEVIAPKGDEHERMASGSLMTAPSIAGQEPRVVESSSQGAASSSAGRDPHIVASARSLGNAPSQRIRQYSLPQATSATPSTVIAELVTVSGSMNFRSFAEHVDAVIKANSAAQVIPFAEAIAEEVLKQQQLHATQQHGTRVFQEIWSEYRN